MPALLAETDPGAEKSLGWIISLVGVVVWLKPGIWLLNVNGSINELRRLFGFGFLSVLDANSAQLTFRSQTSNCANVVSTYLILIVGSFP